MPVSDDLDLARVELDGTIALVFGTAGELEAHRHQFDRVLQVVDVATERPASSMPTHFDTATELVLVHPAGCELPRATTTWLASTSASDHHHIRTGRADDVDRLVIV